MTLKFNIGL